MAGRLRLTDGDDEREMTVDAAPLDEMNAELLQFTVPKGSHIHGVTIDELRLPTASNGHTGGPRGSLLHARHWLRIRAGDQILIVMTDGMRASRREPGCWPFTSHGRLAGWVTPVTASPPVTGSRACAASCA